MSNSLRQVHTFASSDFEPLIQNPSSTIENKSKYVIFVKKNLIFVLFNVAIHHMLLICFYYLCKTKANQICY